MTLQDIRDSLAAISLKLAGISSDLSSIEDAVDYLEENQTCEPPEEPEEPNAPVPVDCLAGTLPLNYLNQPWSSSDLVSGELNEVDYVSRRPEIRTAMSNAPSGSICLLGDSIIYSLNASAIAPNAVNMGIGGESTRQFLYRLNDLDSNNNPNLIHRASAGVMLIGINDGRDGSYYGTQQNAVATVGPYMLNKIQQWQTGKWVIVKLIKVNESGSNASGVTNATYVNGINGYIDTYYANRQGFKIVDINPIVAPSGSLSSTYDSGDGLHLNAAGKVVLQDAIKVALQELSVI